MKPDQYPLEPAHLWQHFYEITQIPRPSKEEAAVRQYVIAQAEQAACVWQMDEQGNLLVRVPASPGLEASGTVIIQNHLDMVTVKTEDKAHDFSRDPLDLQVVDGWLLADRTTLGADNGVGCAAALALMTDQTVAHPPLELLFTVDEETGLGGALNLDGRMLTGDRMLNLDTEDWHELYIGCAGGGGWQFHREFTVQETAGEFWQLELKGLAGGHSGIQIHQQLGNAIKLLGQLLQGIDGLQLIAVDAGVAHNVIPREARARFACTVGQDIEGMLRLLRAQWLSYLPAEDAALALVLAPMEPQPALSVLDTAVVLTAVAAMPHGAQSYSLAQPADLVNLSINLAMLRLQGGVLFLESSYRFFNEAESEPLQQSVLAIAKACGLRWQTVVGYPGWEPVFDSQLLRQGKALHSELFGFEPAVKAIHAGLECGILKSKKPDTDILSFGPTIRGAHSPSERLQIETVAPFWQFLTYLLARM
jgi:dipeptidase D